MLFFWSSLALNVSGFLSCSTKARGLVQPEGKLAGWGFLSSDPVVLHGCLTGFSRAIFTSCDFGLQEALEALPVEIETPLDPETSHSALNPLLFLEKFLP